MDKTGIIVVTLCALLLGWWFIEQNKYAKEQAEYARTHPISTPTAVQGVLTNGSNVTNQLEEAIARASGRYIGPGVLPTNSPEQTMVLTNGKARYTFTSRGGGLKLVELLDYPETISARWTLKGGAQTNGVASLNALAPVPALSVLGDASLVGDGSFTLSKTGDGVIAEKILTNGLKLTKVFHLGSNYLINANIRLSNTTDQPLLVPAQEIVVGTATPMDPDDNGQGEGAMWSDGAKATDQPLAAFLGGGCSRAAPKTEIVTGSGNVAWAAAHNQFFALIGMPKDRAQQMVARPLLLPQFANVTETNATPPRGIQTALVYPATTLSANSSVDRQVLLFAGPKEYRTLADIGAQFQNRADDVMGFGSIYGFCAKPLLLAMNWLHDVTTLGYGLVIVLLTVLLRAVFWPLTAASTRSMKRMQALAPEMAALKE